MSRLPEHLQRTNGGTYRLRMRIPAELHAIAGKTEIIRSLKTKELREARRLIMRERAAAIAQIEEYRRRATPHGKQSLDDLTDDEMWLLMSRWFVERERDEAPLLTHECAESRMQDLGYLTDLGDTSAAASVHATTRRFLEARRIELDERSPAFRRLSLLIHRAMVEHDKRLINRAVQQGLPLDPAFSHLSSQTELRGLEAVRLSDLISRYEGDRGRKKLGVKSQLKREGHVRVIKEFFGERTLVDGIDRERLLDFRECLQTLPANATKRFKGLSVKQVLQLPQELRGAPMHAATANPYMAFICRLLTYGHGQGVISRLPSFDDLMLEGGGHSEEDREPFTLAELQRLFSAPLFTGCIDDQRGYGRPGPNRPRRARFWIPLIALYSGARLQELCQLREDNVIEVVGVHLIRVTDIEDDQRTKNKNALRTFPVHPALVEMGFIDFVRGIREGGGPKTRLFPELTMASTGYYSDNFSKWFRNFADKCGVSKSMHSFRHNFNDACELGAIPRDRVAWVAGWSAKDTQGSYLSERGRRLHEVDELPAA